VQYIAVAGPSIVLTQQLQGPQNKMRDKRFGPERDATLLACFFVVAWRCQGFFQVQLMLLFDSVNFGMYLFKIKVRVFAFIIAFPSKQLLYFADFFSLGHQTSCG